MFLPTWIITSCIYHPEDLGALKSICVSPNNTIDNTHTRHKRDTQSDNEGVKIDSFTDKMLLLKFKYNYAQKSGYEKYWICSKLHPSTARIPLMAVPLNIILFLNGTPPVVLTNISSLYVSNIVTFPTMGRSHSPDWCFK